MNKSNRNWLLLLIWSAMLLAGGCRPAFPQPQPTQPVESNSALTGTQPVSEKDATLASLQKVSDFPLYTMHYVGDYGFGEYLRKLKSKLSSVESRRAPVHAASLDMLPAFACTTFTASTPQGERLLGRNFDWYHHPALLLLGTWKIPKYRL